jgi:hypothetical protein
MTETPDDNLDLRGLSPELIAEEVLVPDALLKELVMHAQGHPDARQGLVLDLHGVRISGLLVGRDVWMDLFAEQSPGLAGMLGEDFKFGTDMSTDRNQRDEFIHMINARSVDGAGGIPSIGLDGVMWRGRLASVDGWSLGEIGRIKS